MYSTPQQLTQILVPDTFLVGDTLQFAVPIDTPEGGNALGAHTLQIRMFTHDGFEVLATGLTIESLTPSIPTQIPAGQDSRGAWPLWPLGLLLLAFLRRTNDMPKALTN